MLDKFELGDVVRMKKKHPCGAQDWEIIRVGADVKLRCSGCGRVVMLDRQQFVKSAVRIIGPNKGESHEL